jgi:hypothetical protein
MRGCRAVRDGNLLAQFAEIDAGVAYAGCFPVDQGAGGVAGPGQVARPDIAVDEDGFALRLGDALDQFVCSLKEWRRRQVTQAPVSCEVVDRNRA